MTIMLKNTKQEADYAYIRTLMQKEFARFQNEDLKIKIVFIPTTVKMYQNIVPRMRYRIYSDICKFRAYKSDDKNRWWTRDGYITNYNGDFAYHSVPQYFLRDCIRHSVSKDATYCHNIGINITENFLSRDIQHPSETGLLRYGTRLGKRLIFLIFPYNHFPLYMHYFERSFPPDHDAFFIIPHKVIGKYQGHFDGMIDNGLPSQWSCIYNLKRNGLLRSFRPLLRKDPRKKSCGDYYLRVYKIVARLRRPLLDKGKPLDKKHWHVCQDWLEASRSGEFCSTGDLWGDGKWRLEGVYPKDVKEFYQGNEINNKLTKWNWGAPGEIVY